MPQSQAVTETIILYVKEDINLEYALSEAGDSGSPAAKAFAQLTNTVKAQQGFIRQYWVLISSPFRLVSLQAETYGIGSSSRRFIALSLVYWYITSIPSTNHLWL